MAHNVEIYSSMNCPYCVAAKNFLKQKGLDYTEIRIDTDPTQRDKMVARTHRRTVPQIFIDGHHVGGFDDMVAADRDGRLAKILGSPA
ncbi:MAG TPA: glutaredoxin 3 [Rudaea sp.]|jgi:glutaredoxin 3|nr:glutaredoxin 3 [Rudaea sp.]